MKSGLFLDFILLIIPVLINVAFITLLERKILGYSQYRVGPNKVSILGIMQPFSDAIKLFTKNWSFPMSSNWLLFMLSPMTAFLLIIWLWMITPSIFGGMCFKFSILILLMIMGLNVYPSLLSGWSSSSKYAFIGGVRNVAQTISYEISLALILMVLIIFLPSMNVEKMMMLGVWQPPFYFMPIVFILWMISALAETNRTPFDFSEGESELVSGFNVEYGAGGFALIFMAEYSSILFLSSITSMLFFGVYSIMWSLMTTLMVFLWVWARATFPRFRYDSLMSVAWKSILPSILGYLCFTLMIEIFYL